MTTLIYTFAVLGKGKRPVLTEISQGDGSRARLIFKDCDSGTLSLQGKSFPLKRGAATVELSELAEGLVCPTLLTEAGGFPLSPLELAGGRIFSREHLSDELITLRGRAILAEEAIAKLEERLARVEERLGREEILRL